MPAAIGDMMSSPTASGPLAAAGTKRKQPPTADSKATHQLEDAMAAYFLEANTTDELSASLNDVLHDGASELSAEEAAFSLPDLDTISSTFAAIVAGSQVGSGSTSPNHSATHAADAPHASFAAAGALTLAVGADEPALADEMALSSLDICNDIWSVPGHQDIWSVLDAFTGAEGPSPASSADLGGFSALALAPVARGGATRRPPGKKAGAPTAGRAASAARKRGPATSTGAPADACALAIAAAALFSEGRAPPLPPHAAFNLQPPLATPSQLPLPQQHFREALGLGGLGGSADGSDGDSDGEFGGSANGGDMNERKMKRMRRNRESAMRSRHRRKAYIDELEAKVAELSHVINRLATEGYALRIENEHLRTLALSPAVAPPLSAPAAQAQNAALSVAGSQHTGHTQAVEEGGVEGGSVEAEFGAETTLDTHSGSRSTGDVHSGNTAQVGSASFRPEAALPLSPHPLSPAWPAPSPMHGISGGIGGSQPLAVMWSGVATTHDDSRAAAARRLLGLDATGAPSPNGMGMSEFALSQIREAAKRDPPSAWNPLASLEHVFAELAMPGLPPDSPTPIPDSPASLPDSPVLLPDSPTPLPDAPTPLTDSHRTTRGGPVIRLPPDASWGDAELIELTEKQVAVTEPHSHRRAE
ncbi:hypothetical protein T492DRAFT_1105843, partial [Pavlovales sp. CCMP2436]